MNNAGSSAGSSTGQQSGHQSSFSSTARTAAAGMGDGPGNGDNALVATAAAAAVSSCRDDTCNKGASHSRMAKRTDPDEDMT